MRRLRWLLFCLVPLFGTNAEAKPAIRGALDSQVVARVIRQRQARFMLCFEKALRRSGLRGGIDLQFTITAAGTVDAVIVGGANPTLQACITKVTRSLRFPKPKGGGIVRVAYPFRFKSAGDGFGGESSTVFPRRYDHRIEAPMATKLDHLSTFAVDVDTASYSIARRTLLLGTKPEPTLVRVEEFINYFRYDYDPPLNDRFSIQLDGAQSPVDGAKHLLRIGLQARVVSPQERLPANLVFLVDTSCSMTQDDKLELAKKSLKIAVRRLDARDRVAITTYAGGVSLVLPPTRATERTRINNAIDQLRPDGGTAMASGLTTAYRQAVKMLGDNTSTRIIVCSDGDANIGATSHQDMLASVKSYVSEGVTISTIGFGDSNYRDETMEQIANLGNGNYYYIDGLRQANRVFGRDLFKMIQDVAQDVKIQVDFDPQAVKSYRLVGYENRAVDDKDFRDDRKDGGEIGAGHQVTAIYELTLNDAATTTTLGTIRVRGKAPRGMRAEEVSRQIDISRVRRPFSTAPADLRFATAVMAGAELLRRSKHAKAWSYDRVITILSDDAGTDPDRAEFLDLMKRAKSL